jgi:membrane fusion protein (multidrug efflux system)
VDEVWITANFKETQVSDLATGQDVRVVVDGDDNVWDGTVEAVTPSTGGRFSMLPPDNSSGNFTKVVQRVPVRIKLPPDAAQILRPGESAEVTVYTR